jgi:hypothetical protein
MSVPRPLTVGELIDALSAVDPDLIVAATYDGGQIVGATGVHTKSHVFMDRETYEDITVELAVIDGMEGYNLGQWVTGQNRDR